MNFFNHSSSSVPWIVAVFFLLFSLPLTAGPLESEELAEAVEQNLQISPTEETEETSMESLHDDCLREIFRKLDLVSLAQVRRVNSSFCQLLCDPLFLSELRLSREDSEQSVPLLSAEKYVRLFQSSYPSNVLRLHFKTPQEVMRFIRHSREQEYRQVILDFSELPSLQFLSWLDLQPLATWKHLEELTLLISLNSPLQTENLLDASTHAWLLNLLKSLDAKSSALKSLKIFEVIRTYSRFQTHSYYLRGNIPFEVLAEVSKFNRLSQFMKFSKVLGPPPAGYRLPIDESQSTFELGMGTLVSINPSDSPSSHPGQLRPQSWVEKMNETLHLPNWVSLALERETIRIRTYPQISEAPPLNSPFVEHVLQKNSYELMELCQIKSQNALIESGRWQHESLNDPENPSSFRHITFDL